MVPRILKLKTLNKDRIEAIILKQSSADKITLVKKIEEKYIKYVRFNRIKPRK